MTDKELEVVLNGLREETYPKEEFPSKDDFKKSFFKAVEESDKIDKKQTDSKTVNPQVVDFNNWSDPQAARQAEKRKTSAVMEYVVLGLCASAVVVVGVAFYGNNVADLFGALGASMHGMTAACQLESNCCAGAVRDSISCTDGDFATAHCNSVHAAHRELADARNHQTAIRDSAVAQSSRPARTAEREHVAAPTPHGIPPASVPHVRPPVPAPREIVAHEAPKNYNTEEYKPFEDNPFMEVRSNPLSTFGADVDTASYTNLRRIIRSGILPNRNVVRTEELVNYFNYDYPAPQNGEKFAVNFEMMDAPWNPKHKLLLIGVQAKKVDVKDLPPSNFVFLIDNSGSMTPYMPLVRESMAGLADNLRPQDTISIVTYGGGVNTVLQGVRGSASNKGLLQAKIRTIRAGGYTPGSAGIQKAYELAHEYFIKGGNNRIVLISDGDFNVGASSESDLISMVEKERQSSIYLTAVGVGRGNYKDNKLKMMANKGNGNYLYWDSIQEARKSLINEMTGSMFTLAKDVKFQLEMNPAKVHSYRQIGYELRQLAARDFNNDAKDSGEVGVGQQVTVLYELVMADGKNKNDVDPLKYQEIKTLDNGELLTCKIRYQEPEGNAASVKKTFVLNHIPEATDNIRWAASVAEFALIMRNSEYKGSSDLMTLRQRAQKNIGNDANGKRLDFLCMLRDAENINKRGPVPSGYRPPAPPELHHLPPAPPARPPRIHVRRDYRNGIGIAASMEASQSCESDTGYSNRHHSAIDTGSAKGNK